MRLDQFTQLLARESGKDGHWRWIGEQDPQNVRVGEHRGARRIAYYAKNPAAGAGQVENSCGVADCVKPAHQRFVGYHTGGMDQSAKIRTLDDEGLMIKDIAKELGISRQTVWRALKPKKIVTGL